MFHVKYKARQSYQTVYIIPRERASWSKAPAHTSPRSVSASCCNVIHTLKVNLLFPRRNRVLSPRGLASIVASIYPLVGHCKVDRLDGSVGLSTIFDIARRCTAEEPGCCPQLVAPNFQFEVPPNPSPSRAFATKSGKGLEAEARTHLPHWLPICHSRRARASYIFLSIHVLLVQ